MTEVVISNEFELVAQAMLQTRGNLAKASRYDTVEYNAMSLRAIVKDNPEIRQRYHELLAEEMQEKGLHIAERILKMAEMQEESFGGTIIDGNGEEQHIPADPATAIRISQEISRLIAEGKGQPMSGSATLILAATIDGKELLKSFLDD